MTLSPTDGQPAKPSSAETAPSCIWPPRESVGSSQWRATRRPVIALYWSARRIRPGEHDRAAVVGERGGAGVGELAHLGQLRARLALRDRGQEADRDLGLGPRLLDERGEHGGRVDDRLGVRHREDRAVAAGRGRRGAGGDRLLVLAAGRAQVDVRVDERRREHEPGAVDDAVPFASSRRRARDHAVVDADVERPRRRPRSGRGRARRGRRGLSVVAVPAERASRHLHRGLGGDADRAVGEQVVEHGHARRRARRAPGPRSARRPSRRRAGRSRRRGSSARGASPSGPAAAARA